MQPIMAGDAASFLREFARHPLTVGAVAPSGQTLSQLATATVPRTGHPIVVELGPGTGAFTAAIQRRLAGRGHHLAVEINERFAGRLAQRFDGRVDVAAADARELPRLLAARGLGQANVIVSGLPWAAFAPALQHEILSSIGNSLSLDGSFTTFAYVHALWSPPARRLRKSLEARFEEVITSRTIWGNLPPALVYHCRRPIDALETQIPAATVVASAS